MRSFLLLSILSLHFASLALDTPKPDPKIPLITKEERPADWLMSIEKIRTLPRPGDIQNAGVLANIGDIVETTLEQKAQILEATKAYDAALLKKAEAWENELKALRTEHQAKILAALPEARREAAKKALDYSHSQWFTPFDFEVKLRSDFLQKRLALENKATPPEEIEAMKKEFISFIKTQRQKSVDRNIETVKTLKAMFDAKESERLNSFDRNREVPVPEKLKK